MTRYISPLLFALGLIWLIGHHRPTSAAETPTSYTVQRGDTLLHIAQAHHVTINAMIRANDLPNPNFIYVGQRLTIPEQGHYHVVMVGDTLSAIALRYGVSLSELRTLNQLSNPDLLYVGRSLRLPLTVQQRQSGLKEIVVDLSQQRAYLYEESTLIHQFIVSTGGYGRETVTGQYTILNKLPVAYASTWNLSMPYWLGIYWAGPLQNGFHALPIMPDGSRLWDGYLGTPVSYGCIILNDSDAETLYNWADLGTSVVIQN